MTEERKKHPYQHARSADGLHWGLNSNWLPTSSEPPWPRPGTKSASWQR